MRLSSVVVFIILCTLFKFCVCYQAKIFNSTLIAFEETWWLHFIHSSSHHQYCQKVKCKFISISWYIYFFYMWKIFLCANIKSVLSLCWSLLYFFVCTVVCVGFVCTCVWWMSLHQQMNWVWMWTAVQVLASYVLQF